LTQSKGHSAYLFDLVRDSARRLACFDRLYRVITSTIGLARAWLHRQPVYRSARRAVHAIGIRVKMMVADVRQSFTSIALWQAFQGARRGRGGRRWVRRLQVAKVAVRQQVRRR
jgi:hypothetical protein